MKQLRAFYRIKEICEDLGISRPTLWRWQRDGEFPASVRLAGGVPAVPGEAYRDWCKSKIKDQSTPEAP